jgi:hypothetical protein
MEPKTYRFVGGSQDGKALPVPQPIRQDMEFLVRPGEPYLPWESYRLGEDGQFHYEGLGLTTDPELPTLARDRFDLPNTFA